MQLQSESLEDNVPLNSKPDSLNSKPRERNCDNFDNKTSVSQDMEPIEVNEHEEPNDIDCTSDQDPKTFLHQKNEDVNMDEIASKQFNIQSGPKIHIHLVDVSK